MSSQVPAHQPSQNYAWPEDLLAQPDSDFEVEEAVPLEPLFHGEEMLQDDFSLPIQHTRDNNWLKEQWERVNQLAAQMGEDAPPPIVVDLRRDLESEYFTHHGVIYVC